MNRRTLFASFLSLLAARLWPWRRKASPMIADLDAAAIFDSMHAMHERLEFDPLPLLAATHEWKLPYDGADIRLGRWGPA